MRPGVGDIDIVRKLTSQTLAFPSGQVNVKGVADFVANNGTTGVKLWKRNAAPVGTTSLRNIRVGAGSSSPHELVNVNGTRFLLLTMELVA